MIVYMVAICALCSLGVDFGRVQLAKTELRRAADSAARAAAAGLATDASEAIRLAKLYAQHNKVDGQPLALETGDIEFGRWDRKNATFELLTGDSINSANAVHVTARRSKARGNAIPTMFASLVGFDSCDISADAIVMIIPPIDVDQNVPATANPFLSGMPPGTVASGTNPHNNPDYAGVGNKPKQSPLAVKMPIVAGESYTFDSIEGTARHDPNLPYFNPDGELTDIGHNNLTTKSSNSYGSTYYNEHGIADMRAPINALVGLFLSDEQPSKTKAPKNLDFSSEESRDFSELKPQLKQIFFIGDGLNSKGNRQTFVAPPGATRLFLATWDFYEWNNNAGYRNVKVQRPMQIITVK